MVFLRVSSITAVCVLLRYRKVFNIIDTKLSVKKVGSDDLRLRCVCFGASLVQAITKSPASSIVQLRRHLRFCT
jgi:hypothetical protein